jgi:Tol biopolymer transport system component
MKTKAVILLVAAVCTGALFLSGYSNQSTEDPEPNHAFVDKIIVASDRHVYDPTKASDINNAEIYVLNLDGSGEQRVTFNAFFDAFGALSPDGKKIAFISNRNRGVGEPANTSDVFVMNADGTDQTFLARGGPPAWSPDSKYVAFHASASGTGRPINNNPGAATEDSDIFIANVDDLLDNGTPPWNLTNDPDHVDDDPDWSPDGSFIVYTSHDVNQRPPNLDYTTAEVYVRAADGTGTPIRLTDNIEEERAPDWSKQGDRIAYMCRTGSPRFEICVMAADGSNQQPVTDNEFADLTPAWSPNDDRIFFHRPIGTPARNQLFWVAADGSTEQILVPSSEPTGQTLFANIGVLRVKIDK